MAKKRNRFIGAIFVTMHFVFFNAGIAQTHFIKSLFFNLPIDSSKVEITKALNSDTTLFQSGSSQHRKDDLSFKVMKNSEYFVKTSFKPTITIYDTKFYVDSIYKYTTSTLSLLLQYESALGCRRKARKAFLHIAKQSEKEFFFLYRNQ